VYAESLGTQATQARETTLKGEHDMTKERARQRAKSRAAGKTGERKADAGGHDETTRPGRFDPGQGSIKSPGRNGGNVIFGGMRRGAARSR
jgi:hypothetical protein